MTLEERLKKWNTSRFSQRPARSHHEKVHHNAAEIPTMQGTSDSRRKGLQLLNDTKISAVENETVYVVDIVFVHGLNGDSMQTWTHENGVCWPRDLLPSAMPGGRIFSYGYPSQIIATKSVAGIHDFANHLLDDLGVVRKETSRPIIYVCHSLGGIVVKQALITACSRKESHDLWLQCNAVIFMGTPHHGSPYATYGKILGDVVNVTMHLSLTHRFTGGIRTDLIKALAQGNADLQDISKKFCLLLKDSPIHVISFYETEAHPLTNRTIVDKASAQLGVEREQFKPLFLNHQNLCRFSGNDDVNYVKVCNAIKSEAPMQFSTDITVTSSLGTNYSYDETEKACASLLNSVDVMEYESKLDVRVEGTLEWVLQNFAFKEWKSNPEARLLWVTGFAGSGKTLLTSFVSQHLTNYSSRTLVSKFFCDEKIKEFCNPLVLLKSIIFQIVDRRKRHWRLVTKACDAGSFKIFSQFDALWCLFVKIIQAEKKYNLVVIIDAIDELNQKDQLKVINRISGLLSLEKLTSVKFLITSRPNAECAIDFENCSPYMVQLLLEDSKQHIDTDIKSVVHHRLERMVKRGACRPLVRDGLEKILVAKADQTFLWIKFVLPLLEQHRLLLSSEAELITSALPTTLTSLYRRLLMDIPARERVTAAKVLRLLTVCDRPLTGNEIGILLTITPDDRSISSLNTEQLLLGKKSVQALLGPLIRIYNDQIELVHLSLKEYLINLSLGIQDELAFVFGVDMIRDKVIIFRACSMYLSLEEFGHNMFALLDTTADDLSDGDKISSSPHSSYYAPDLGERDIITGWQLNEHTPTNKSLWASINVEFQLFDYAALHWAIDFAKCYTKATDHDSNRALSLCDTDSSQPPHWFRYVWHKQAPLEAFPAAVDRLMLVSFFGHLGNLLQLLDKFDSIDGQSLSRALYWAARQGHSSCVNVLLKQALCDPQYFNQRDQTSLSVAAQYGHLECVSLLLKDIRVNVNLQDNYGRTALSRAVSNSHNDIVTLLLEQKTIDINLSDHALNTPLHLAVNAASMAIFHEILTDDRTKPELLNNHDRSILSLAAELGDTERVIHIIENTGIQINQKDATGRTPLSYASQQGHLSVVRRLIESRQADPLCKDKNGRNAHSWAAVSKSTDVLHYLTKRCPQGADVPDQDDWAPLAWTLDPPGHPSNMLELLRRGNVDVERTGGVHGRTVLSWAANYRNAKMASILIQVKGINLDARDVFARTPLSEAAGNGSLEIVQLLLATDKVDLNSRDQWGQTPLFWAVKGGHLEIVKLLLSTPEIVVDIEDNSGETAMELARKLDENDIITELANRTVE